MGVEIPELDDRDYAALVEDARKRIPVHSEDWTDHNAHDPGITIVETLAWITETYLYQLDRVTDAHREKYLRLLGDEPRPPEPASVRLKVQLRSPDESSGATDRDGPPLDGERIDEGTALVASDGTGVERRFETARPITLTGARIARVVSEYGERRVDNSTANDVDGMYFLPFGEEADAGSEMYLGFDGDPFANADRLDLTVAFHEVGLPEPASHGDEVSDFEPSVAVSWQYCVDYAKWFRDENWKELRVLGDGTSRSDETNRFYRGGTLTIEKPADWHPDTWNRDDATVLDRAEGLIWIRCRVETTGYEVPPQFESIDTNVVEARHRSRVENAILKRSDDGDGTIGIAARATGSRRGASVHGTAKRAIAGEETTSLPGQTFVFVRESGTEPEDGPTYELVDRPVLGAEIVVIETDGRDGDEWTGTEKWEEVPDFDASGPDDRDYVLDRSRGEVRFGDGVRGKVPEAGRNVGARWYVHGGGTGGNVPASATFRFSDEEYAGLAVTPIGPAAGGRDAESVPEALVRLRRDLETPYRAVSAADYRYVAEYTPGLRFGRAKALVRDGGNGDDGDDRVNRDGETPTEHRTVSVVVVPFSTRRKPEPSEGFLNAVRRHLLKHRLLTDRVTVERPTYVGIRIAAEIGVAPGYRVAGRVAETKKALDAFLSPLSVAGSESDAIDDAEGWPFGRPLYVSEVYAVLEGVEGVEDVFDVSITARDAERIDDDGNVLIADTALLYPEDHDVIARTSERRYGERA